MEMGCNCGWGLWVGNVGWGLRGGDCGVGSVVFGY